MGRNRHLIATVMVVFVSVSWTTMASASAAQNKGHLARDVGSGATSRALSAGRAARIELSVGAWQEFSWDGGDGAAGPTVTFRSRTAVVVTITDAFCPGDRFRLEDGEVPLGVTSVPGRSTCRYKDSTSHPNEALADPSYTHGAFVVAAGRHAIGIVASASPFGGGAGFIRIDPMTKAMCKSGGWAAFGGARAQFTNQGACLSVVVPQ